MNNISLKLTDLEEKNNKLEEKIAIGLILLTIAIGYVFNKKIPYLCKQGISTLCGL